jgi:hypothetical protein
MSGLEWMVLIVGLGLGWGVVSLLTGQRKPAQRTEPAAAEGEPPTPSSPASQTTDLTPQVKVQSKDPKDTP